MEGAPMDRSVKRRGPAQPTVLRAARLDPLQDTALMRLTKRTNRNISDVIKDGIKHECETNGIPWPEDDRNDKAS
jgi:hypothetical protein